MGLDAQYWQYASTRNIIHKFDWISIYFTGPPRCARGDNSDELLGIIYIVIARRRPRRRGNPEKVVIFIIYWTATLRSR